MLHRAKWIEEKLGIKRRDIRTFRENKLISTNNKNLINGYYEYTDEDIDEIWAIKLLLDLGYTVPELKKIKLSSNCDFFKSLELKVNQAENNIKRTQETTTLAKTILSTGICPNVKEYGVLKFDDYIEYIKKNWNFCEYLDNELFDNISVDNITDEQLDRLETLFNKIGINENMTKFGFEVHSYYKIISELKNLKPNNEVIKIIMDNFYNCCFDNMKNIEGREISPIDFAIYYDPFHYAGHLLSDLLKRYDEDAVKFIAKVFDEYLLECKKKEEN